MKGEDVRTANFLLLIMLPILLLSGCASSLQMSQNDINTLKNNSGIIIGSYLVTYPSESTGHFSKTLEDTKWTLYIRPADESFIARYFSFGGYRISGIVGGKEQYFTAQIPSGRYELSAIKSANRKGYIRGFFNVEPNVTTYVGRIVLDVQAFYVVWGSFDFHIEDKMDETIPKIKGQHADLNVNTIVKSLIQK